MKKQALILAVWLAAVSPGFCQEEEVIPIISVQIQMKEKIRVQDQIYDLREQARRIKENIEAMTQKLRDQSAQLKARIQDLKIKADQSKLLAVQLQTKLRDFVGSEASQRPRSNLNDKHLEMAARNRDNMENLKAANERVRMAIERQKDFVRNHR